MTAVPRFSLTVGMNSKMTLASIFLGDGQQGDRLCSLYRETMTAHGVHMAQPLSPSILRKGL